MATPPMPVVTAAGAQLVTSGAGGGGSGSVAGAPLGYQQIVTATLATATPLTAPAGATVAYIVVEGVDVRWRDDGVAPTATVGMLLPAGATLSYSGSLAVIEFIETAAGSILNISYYEDLLEASPS